MPIAPLRSAPLGWLKLILGLALLALIVAPTTSVAAPPPPPVPQLDTATATGTAIIGGATQDINIDVHSGPSGEDPGGSAGMSGFVEIRGEIFPAQLGGTPTCLQVTGSTAVIGIDNAIELIGDAFVVPYGPVKFTLEDHGGSGLDRFGFAGGSSDCSTPGGTVPLNGRAVVFDAQPLPTSKAQCLNGGWQSAGFENLGLCIRFVTHG